MQTAGYVSSIPKISCVFFIRIIPRVKEDGIDLLIFVHSFVASYTKGFSSFLLWILYTQSAGLEKLLNKGPISVFNCISVIEHISKQKVRD